MGQKAGLGRGLVGKIHREWLTQQPAKPAPSADAAVPHLTLVPPPAPTPTVAARTPATRSDDGGIPSVEAVVPMEGGEESFTGVTVKSATAVQHLGSWLLVAMVARLGLHQNAVELSEQRVRAGALRVALDAVVVALAIGQRCVEGCGGWRPRRRRRCC